MQLLAPHEQNDFENQGVAQLRLDSFRNYHNLDLSIDAPHVVLWGENGAGKTNLLEALSYLSPGKGMRRAKLTDLRCNQDEKTPWFVFAKVKNGNQYSDIGTSIDNQNGVEKRIVRVDGRTLKNQTHLLNHLSLVWLTPQMDRLFLEGASARRRFLDRLIQAITPSFADNLSIYEQAMHDRLNLLKARVLGEKIDDFWLSALETTMAQKSVFLTTERQNFCNQLSWAMSDKKGSFPAAKLMMQGIIEEYLETNSALAAEEFVKQTFEKNRGLDGHAETTTFGCHKSDLLLIHLNKNIAAKECSTGEQKSLLVSIMLSFAKMKRVGRTCASNVLLLDEPATHLDYKRRFELFEELIDLNMQVWLTGTDSETFAPLAGHAQFFHVDQGIITETRPGL